MEDKKVITAANVGEQDVEKQQAVVLSEEYEMDFRTTKPIRHYVPIWNFPEKM